MGGSRLCLSSTDGSAYSDILGLSSAEGLACYSDDVSSWLEGGVTLCQSGNTLVLRALSGSRKSLIEIMELLLSRYCRVGPGWEINDTKC